MKIRHGAKDWVYIGEFNRPRGDNIRRTATRLRRKGIVDVTHFCHLTTLRMVRPSGMSFSEFKAILRVELQPRIGGMVLFSRRTGNAFRCSNKGNRPGVFLKDE